MQVTDLPCMQASKFQELADALSKACDKFEGIVKQLSSSKASRKQ